MTTTGDRPGAASRSRLGLVMVGLAVVLGVLGIVGLEGSERYVVIDRRLGQPYALFLLATGTLAVSLVVLVRPLWLGAVIGTAALGMGGYYFCLGWFFTSGHHERQEARSPNGAYEAVVTDEFAIVDPVYRVRVRQTRGLLARQWTVGCDEFVNDLRWDGSDTLVLLWDDRENPVEEIGRVRVDPSSGRPLGTSPLSSC